MSNFGVTAVSPSVLLRMLQDQLSQSGQPAGSNQPGAGLGSNAFLSVFSDDVHLANPTSTQFVAIRPTHFPVWQGVVTGAGILGFDAMVTLTCFEAVTSDPEMKNVNALSEQVLSVTDFVMQVVSALQFWQPNDGGTPPNDYLREPARIPDEGLSFSPVTGKGGPWHKTSFPLQFKFTALMPSLSPGT